MTFSVILSRLYNLTMGYSKNDIGGSKGCGGVDC